MLKYGIMSRFSEDARKFAAGVIYYLNADNQPRMDGWCPIGLLLWYDKIKSDIKSPTPLQVANALEKELGRDWNIVLEDANEFIKDWDNNNIHNHKEAFNV